MMMMMMAVTRLRASPIYSAHDTVCHQSAATTRLHNGVPAGRWNHPLLMADMRRCTSGPRRRCRVSRALNLHRAVAREQNCRLFSPAVGSYNVRSLSALLWRMNYSCETRHAAPSLAVINARLNWSKLPAFCSKSPCVLPLPALSSNLCILSFSSVSNSVTIRSVSDVKILPT